MHPLAPARPLLLLALVATLAAGDPALAQAPQPVQDTVAKRFPQATIQACKPDGAHGWSVTLTDTKGQRHVLQLTEDGKLTSDNGNDPDHRPGGVHRARLAK